MSQPLVRDIMTIGVPTCHAKAPIVNIARLLHEKSYEGVVVLNAHGHGIGIVTREILLDAFGRPDFSCQLTAEEIMSEAIPEIPPDIPIQVAVQMMRDMNTRIVFLMHHGGGVGYPSATLTYEDILEHIALEKIALL